MLGHKNATETRYGWENVCRTALRLYQGTPPDHQRWMPFENAPLIEVTIGASDCDAVISQAEDLIFSMDPALMVRARKKGFEDAAEAMQDLIDRETATLLHGGWNFESGIKEGIIDQVMLGTVVWYIPYTKTVRVTDIRTVETFGPKIYCIDPADFILPSNATKDIQSAKFCTLRLNMSKAELNLRARLNAWTVDDAGTPDSSSPIRADRLRTAGLTGGGPDKKPTIQIGVTYCYFDFGDGIERDLEVIWNMTSGGLMKVSYHHGLARPFVLECYQDRAHTWAGLGVMEMDIPYEREITEIHNQFIWNMMISNTKMYQGPATVMQEQMEIYPGKFIDNSDGRIEQLDMGEVNPTAIQAESIVRGMSRDRTGLQSLNAPLKASNRTPGFTMQMAMQQANRRFTHPFNNLRNGVAQCVMQCLLRVQERIRANDKQVVKKLEKLLGEEKADLVVNLMKSHETELTEALDIQLKAVSVTVNREADRQNMVMLATQVFPLYWQAKQQLAQFLAHPPFPGADKVAKEASDVLDRFWHKILKTFDSVTDVRSFQIDLDAIQPMMQQLGMEQVPGQLNGALTAMGQEVPQAPNPGTPPQ